MRTTNEEKSENNSYLTFRLGEAKFGLHVSQVLNILEMTKITSVPKSPEYIQGVINLRGMVLPVIDTRIKIGLSASVKQKNTCIVVMDLKFKDEIIHIGAIVDEVLSVIEVEEKDIMPPPGIGNNYKSDFIFGMAKMEEQFIMLMDMNKIFSNNEMYKMTSARENKQEVV